MKTLLNYLNANTIDEFDFHGEHYLFFLSCSKKMYYVRKLLTTTETFGETQPNCYKKKKKKLFFGGVRIYSTYKLNSSVIENPNSSRGKVGPNKKIFSIELRAQIGQCRWRPHCLTWKTTPHNYITNHFTPLCLKEHKRKRKLTDEIGYVKSIGESAGGSASRVVNAVRVVIGSGGREQVVIVPIVDERVSEHEERSPFCFTNQATNKHKN